MANTNSSKKAIRQSNRKRVQNLFWKRKIKNLSKTLKQTVETKNPNADILKKEQSQFQKVLDKAAKNKAIHKNKANRLKARYARKISAQNTQTKAKSKSAGTRSKS